MIELTQLWEAEQVKRHTFWADIDENIKAEFIDGKASFTPQFHLANYKTLHWAISVVIFEWRFDF